MSLLLTQSDHEKTLAAAAGTLATISLAENPTTGFRWAVDHADPQSIELKDSDYVLPSDAGIGAGGTCRMTFELKQPGTVRLSLKLWREWEGDASITERFACTFDVR